MSSEEVYLLFRQYWAAIWPIVLILFVAWAYLMFDDWRKG